MTARTFPARYPGTCQGCGDRIREGDPIGYSDDNEICCADCLNGTTAPVTPTCPDCHLQHAGEC